MTGMEFIWIPAGCFNMGSPPSEQGRNPDEGPVHKVCLDGFWMGRKEVTVGEFRSFVNAAGYATEAEREGFSWVYDDEWKRREGVSWQNPGFPQDETHPAVHLSYNDVLALADWLQKKDGRTFGLPTEAQWEYACRAGTDTARYWGTGSEQACSCANVADLTARRKFPAWVIHNCEDGYIFTAPAGSFRPNDFGLQDMLGNVWEWCQDNYDPDAYRRSKRATPLHIGDGMSHVIRGGSWYSRPEYVRCADRDHVNSPSRRGSDLGFRLVMKP